MHKTHNTRVGTQEKHEFLRLRQVNFVYRRPMTIRTGNAMPIEKFERRGVMSRSILSYNDDVSMTTI